MIKPPKVTVLMPVYNGEKYLKEAIESILNQTFVDFEFLIIDDGSSDKSVEIIRSYKDSRIKLVCSKHFGIIEVLNKGLKLSSGKYIARMDCDDISVKNRLKKQVKFMDDNTEVGICGSWIKIFARFKFFGIILRFPTRPEDIKNDLKTKNVIQHPTVIMRKSLMDKFKLRYTTRFLHAEDYDLWRMASKCFQLANIPEVLLYYRYHPTSVGDLHASEQVDNAKKIGGLDPRVDSFMWKLSRKIARLIAGF